MIKKLKIKFISLSMASMLILMLLLVIGMNLINYISAIKESDGILDMINSQGPSHEAPEHIFPIGRPMEISPEAFGESRYFSVFFEDGEIVYTDLTRISLVDKKEAEGYALRALSEEDERGTLGRFRYLKTETQGATRVSFLDCARVFDTVWGFAIASALMSVVGYIAIFIVVLILSGRITRPAAESYEKQKRFVTDAGHEIKTPLAIIMANTDLLEMENGENEYTEEIRAQTRRLTELTKKLIFLSKMQESERKMEMRELSLTDILSECQSSIYALAEIEEKKIISNTVPAFIKGNDAALRELFSILLDNAIKYSPKGSEIFVEIKKQNKYVAVTVENKCAVPILDKDAEMMFDRFYRADPSRNSERGGHGIGLSVARAVVEAHGGKISTRPTDDEKLIITVLLPI